MITLALLATLSATPATFAAVQSHAAAGDTISLSPGFYGDGLIKSRPVNITGPHEAVFHSLSIQPRGSGSIINGPSCDMKPDATTVTFTTCVKIAGTATDPVKNVRLLNMIIRCGNAVSGILPDADPHLAATQAAWKAASKNVLGLPTGVGLSITYADAPIIQGNNISGCMKGLGVDNTPNALIDENEIHHVRTSMLVGASNPHLTIAHNDLHDTNPWNPRNDGTADHADFIHLWNVPGRPANSDLTVSGNRIDQAQGKPTIGIHLDDQKTGLGFANVRVSGNTAIVADNQGIRIENGNGSVDHNSLLQPAGLGKVPHIVICSDPKYCAPSTIAQTANISTAWPLSAKAIDAARHPGTR